jgi:pimeloyl-ACP methyl ester carboxylesterase
MRNRCPLVVLSFLALVCASIGQIEVQTKYEGAWLPVVGAGRDKAIVIKEGKRRDAPIDDLKVEPATAFGSGLVSVDKIEADLDPLRNLSAQERSRPGQYLFRYTAEVTSQSDLPDCYALLVFVSNGSVGVNLQALGHLRPGELKRVKVENISRVDEVSQLHVFSGTKEIRSNLVSEAYDARELWARLGAGAGVSAVELCKAEEQVPLALSRDGKFLATTRDRGDHFAVIVYDLATMQVVCEVPADKEYKKVCALEWAGPGMVAFLVDDGYLMIDGRWKLFGVTYGKLKLLDVAAKTCTVLRNGVEDIITSVARKPELLSVVVWGPSYDLCTIAYDTKARRTADWNSMQDGWTMLDPNGEPRVNYTYHGTTKDYYARLGASNRWVPLDSTVKQEGLKFSLKGDEYLDRKAQVEQLGADGDIVYISTRIGSDTHQLAAYSLSQGKIVQEIARHPKYDLTGSDYNMCRLLYDKASAKVMGLVYEAEKPKVLWFEPRYAAIQKALEANFPGESVFPVAWSDDGGTFIYFVTSDRNPGVYYAFLTGERKLLPLYAQSDRLDPKNLAKTEPMDFTARDGATIHAYLTLPPHPTGKPMPLLVSIHGGPMARDGWYFSASNQFFATRGYAVLQVNYRGSSGYGATYQAAGLRARLDTVVLDDIADGVRAVLAGQNIDPKRIAVMGASFGGWATYMSLIKSPDLYRAGIAISAVSHLRDQQKDWKSDDNRYGYAVWQDILGRKDFAETERFIDPLLRAAELHQPVYIMHGECDRVVSPTQAGDMLKALKKTNPNVRSMSFDGASHSYWSEHDRVTRLNEIESFLRTYLAPEPSSPAAAPVAAAPQK